MENRPAETKYARLKKSFKLVIRSILTSFSKEDFCKVFSSFSADEQERLHQLLLTVVASLHRNIEDDFENICHEYQVEEILHTVESFIEEHNLNPLSSCKAGVPDVANEVRSAKINEIQHLQGILEEMEKQNQLLRDRIEHHNKSEVHQA